MLSLRHLAPVSATFCLLMACSAPGPKPASSTEAAAAASASAVNDGEAARAAAEAESLPPINCGEGRLARLMNQPETDAVHAAVIAAVGHRHVRWVHPGDAVTMDYEPGRLNVIVNDQGQIAATRCG